MTEPAVVASQILAAMRQGNLNELESGLAYAECLAQPDGSRQPDTEEQAELLGAVAVELREAMARFGRDLTPHLEGVEVHIGLLRHLSSRTRRQSPLTLAATVH
jgi:hypothetical protein